MRNFAWRRLGPRLRQMHVHFMSGLELSFCIHLLVPKSLGPMPHRIPWSPSSALWQRVSGHYSWWDETGPTAVCWSWIRRKRPQTAGQSRSVFPSVLFQERNCTARWTPILHSHCPTMDDPGPLLGEDCCDFSWGAPCSACADIGPGHRGTRRPPVPADPLDPIGWSGPGPKGGSAHITSHDNISGNSVVWNKGHGVAFSTLQGGVKVRGYVWKR